MAYSQNYTTLFEMKVMHAYFLNRGETAFSELEENKQKQVMDEYAFSSFLKIIPTDETRRIMNNQRMLLRSNNQGFNVLASVEPQKIITPGGSVFYKPFIGIDDDLTLEFFVKIGDPAFENYTDLTIDKTQLFLFANYTPEDTVAVTPIPLINGADISNSFLLNEASTAILAEKFTKEQQIGLLGFISLKMKGAFSSITADTTDPDYSGLIPENAQQYRLGFANRSTTWRYRFRDVPYFAETAAELPLTKNGYIPVDAAGLVLKHSGTGTEADPSEYNLDDIYFPSPDVRSVETDPSGNFYSVIYI